MFLNVASLACCGAVCRLPVDRCLGWLVVSYVAAPATSCSCGCDVLVYGHLCRCVMCHSHHMTKQTPSGFDDRHAHWAALYRTINAQYDGVILQEDLNMLRQWEAKWHMSFNPDKCEELRVTKNVNTQYTHNTRYMAWFSTQLTKLNTAEYLGVTIKSKLNWLV